MKFTQRLKELEREYLWRSDIIRKWRRNKFGDEIVGREEVEIWNGKTHILTKGHIVDKGLFNIINLFTTTLTSGAPSTCFTPANGYGAITQGRQRVGTDTTTVTTNATTGLAAEIATNPSSQAGTNSNPLAGQFRTAWSATWNAGVLGTPTVGEVGLFLRLMESFQSYQFFCASALQTSNQLFSRISVADGDFSAFTVNAANPLTIEFRLTVTFV